MSVDRREGAEDPQIRAVRLRPLLAIAVSVEEPVVVDVERRVIEVPALGLVEEFPLDDSVQHRFLEGLDDIGITLSHEADITAFEATRPAWMPSTTSA